jgi:colanic acid/amylovoran biosynthesis glycosyltransferase
MRIAVIVGRFPVLSETFILNQIIGLIERGNKVDIYTLDPQALDNAKVHPEVEKYRLIEQTYYVLNLPKNYCLRLLKGLWLLVANSYKNPLVVLRSLNIFKYGKKAASLKLLYLAIPLLGKEPYDIIHCQFGPLGQQVIQLRELGVLKGKLVTCFRGYELSEYIKQYGNDVYKELFNKGDFFLTNCEYFKRQLLLLGCDEKKLVVHRSGIDCKKFIFSPRYPPSADDRVRIAMIGRLVEKKGTEYSIRAVAKLVETSQRYCCSVKPNVEFNIIGYGLLHEELQQLIQDLNVGDTVKLIGARNSSEIIEIINKSHIFIAPSVTAKNGDKEGIPNVLKEAMAMGLPVISTYHSGIPELVEDGVSGFLVPERDVMALFQKLSYTIAHPEVWHEMGRAGRLYVEKYYDSDKLNDQLVEIYQQILAWDAKLHLN